MRSKKNRIRKKNAGVRSDDQGEYIYRHRFVNGFQKLTKVCLIDGVPSDEIDHEAFYLENADDIAQLQDGMYEELDSSA